MFKVIVSRLSQIILLISVRVSTFPIIRFSKNTHLVFPDISTEGTGLLSCNLTLLTYSFELLVGNTFDCLNNSMASISNCHLKINFIINYSIEQVLVSYSQESRKNNSVQYRDRLKAIRQLREQCNLFHFFFFQEKGR